MSTGNVDLTDVLARFVDEQVRSGQYKTDAEVLRAGLILLKAEEEALEAKRTALLAAANETEAELARGEGVVLAWDELDAWLEKAGAEAPAR